MKGTEKGTWGRTLYTSSVLVM